MAEQRLDRLDRNGDRLRNETWQ